MMDFSIPQRTALFKGMSDRAIEDVLGRIEVNERHIPVEGQAYAEITDVSGKSVRVQTLDAPAVLTLNDTPEAAVTETGNVEELAAYFGVARPSVSRVFAELEPKGYIERDRSRISILDVPGLKEILS